MTVIAAPVLGVPVRYTVDGDALAAAVERAVVPWAALPPDLVSSRPAVEVRLTLVAGGERAVPPVSYDVRSAGHFAFAAGESRGAAAAAEGRASAVVSDSWLGDEAVLREVVVESLTYALITAADRRPVHAAAVRREETLILLAGPSGSGKSTLTYLAHRAGWEVRADDLVFVSGEGRIWSPAHRQCRLAPEAARAWPELAGYAVRRMPNGKERVVVELGTGDVTPWSGAVSVALLSRSGPGRPPRIARADEAQVCETLAARLDPGFDLDRHGAEEAARLLGRSGGWRLEVGEPADATFAALAAAVGTA